jgi:NO-binding membrane sensor protein with MHYT domain
MIQARTSTKFRHVLTWTLIVSLTFGFCSSWSLHFVGMLSCKLDVPIGLDVGLTLFTGALAVGFTFISLGKDVLRKSFQQEASRGESARAVFQDDNATVPLLRSDLASDHLNLEQSIASSELTAAVQGQAPAGRSYSDFVFMNHSTPALVVDRAGDVEQLNQVPHSVLSGSGPGEGHNSNTHQHWSFGSPRVDDLRGMATQGNRPHKDAFIATFEGLLAGFSLETVLMGLLWSLSLTCMHYGGLSAMQIPEGYMTLSPIPVVISAMISWTVCIAGYIYMTNVEPFLSQQVLFSVVAAVGIATMHFTGNNSVSS